MSVRGRQGRGFSRTARLFDDIRYVGRKVFCADVSVGIQLNDLRCILLAIGAMDRARGRD